MDGCPIDYQAVQDDGVPSPRCFVIYERFQEVFQGAICPLNQAVAFGMIWPCASFLYSENMAHFLHQHTIEIRPPVTVHLVGGTPSSYPFREHCFRHCPRINRT